jgi:hypothetical protein
MDFITLKIHRPRPGLNPRTLGPVARTLTTTLPRATDIFITLFKHMTCHVNVMFGILVSNTQFTFLKLHLVFRTVLGFSLYRLFIYLRFVLYFFPFLSFVTPEEIKTTLITSSQIAYQ